MVEHEDVAGSGADHSAAWEAAGSAGEVSVGLCGSDEDGAVLPKRPGKWTRWTEARRRAFLDVLVATCNVSAAAAAIDVQPTAAYRLRQRDPIFAAEWETALEAGFQLLETHLVGVALALSGAVAEADGAVAADATRDFDAGYRMLRYRAAIRDRPPRIGRPATVATREETDAAILRKLAALEAACRRR